MQAHTILKSGGHRHQRHEQPPPARDNKRHEGDPSLCLHKVQDVLASFLKDVAYSVLPAVQGPGRGRLQEALSRLQGMALAAFMRAYPFIHMAQEGLTFSYQLAYLLQSSPYFSPTLHALGQHVVRTSAQELVCPESFFPVCA